MKKLYKMAIISFAFAFAACDDSTAANENDANDDREPELQILQIQKFLQQQRPCQLRSIRSSLYLDRRHGD